MARPFIATVLLAALTSAYVPAAASAQGLSPVQGVWTRVEVSLLTDQGTQTNRNLQSSLYIFTHEFFSVMYVDGPEPRPFRGPRSKSQLSPEEKIAEYDPFVSYSGTYEISDTTITFRPRVALNPSFMAGGSRTDGFELEDNVLWLILRPRPGAGSPIREIRTKLVRLEGALGTSGETFTIE